MLFVLLIVLLLFMLLVPYCVERPIKCVPVCTYSLMAINVAIFLAMTIHANIVLAQQKATYTDEESIARQIIRDVDGANSDVMNDVANAVIPNNANPNGNGSNSANPNDAAQTSPDGVSDAAAEDESSTRTVQKIRDMEDKFAAGKATQDETLQLQSVLWRVQHADDAFTFDPHPTAYKWLAYWVGAPSLVGFFMSMFVHGGLQHIAGNMLFLWLFGRPLEDALGPLIYTLAYLVCGVAAALLYHITTAALMPNAAMTPFMGASGAIAGLQGLFAPRFYRTPVRVFYTTLAGTLVMLLIGGAFGALVASFIGTDGYFIGGLVAIAGIVMWGEETLWNSFRASAAWVLGGFFVWNDLRPVMMEMVLGRNVDGVAHWAHIGGFLCGVAYAFMVGLTHEGKTEFLADDARQSLEKNHGTNALEHAQKLLQHKPGDATALRLVAEAYDTKGSGVGTDGVAHAEHAADAWETAIHAFVRQGDRDGAAHALIAATTKHNGFIMPPKIQFDLGNQMARVGDHIGAAQTLVKIPFTFPDAPESEMALMRSAQLYAQQLQDYKMANYLLQTLLQRHPQTQWRAQIEGALKSTQKQIDDERTLAAANASNTQMPVELPRAKQPFTPLKK